MIAKYAKDNLPCPIPTLNLKGRPLLWLESKTFPFASVPV